MNDFCPILKETCNNKCIFRTNRDDTGTPCSLHYAAISLGNIGDYFYSVKEKKEELDTSTATHE